MNALVKTCNICGGEGLNGISAFHNICAARLRLGLPIRKLEPVPMPEYKVFQGQVFERINGEWVKVLDTVNFR